MGYGQDMGGRQPGEGGTFKLEKREGHSSQREQPVQSSESE